jgi:hypothetical protein
LLLEADDQGRHHGDAADIRVACFPKVLHLFTVEDVEQALTEFATQKMVLRYEVDGEPYVQVAGWWAWQSQNRRAYRSRHPAPEGWTDYAYGVVGFPETYERCLEESAAKRGNSQQIAADSGESPGNAGDFGFARAGLRAGASQSEPIQSKPTQSEPTQSPLPPAAKRRKRLTGNEGFDEFWSSYPRGEEKEAALSLWKKINASDVGDVMAGLARWKVSHQWTKDDGEYVPYAKKFLKDRRWLIVPKGGENGRPSRSEPAPSGNAGEPAKRTPSKYDVVPVTRFSTTVPPKDDSTK